MGIGGWKPWEWVRWKLTTQSQNSENSACTGPRPRATAHGPVYGFTLHSKWFLVRVETAHPLYHILPHTLKIPHSSHPWSLSTPAVPVARKPRAHAPFPPPNVRTTTSRALVGSTLAASTRLSRSRPHHIRHRSARCCLPLAAFGIALATFGMAALDVVRCPVHAGPLLESVAAQLELLRLLLGEDHAKDEQPDEHARAHLVRVGVRVRVRDGDRVGVKVRLGLGLGLARTHPYAHEGELRGRALWHVAAQDGAHLVRGCKGV